MTLPPMSLLAPEWVRELLGAGKARVQGAVELIESADFALATTRVVGAASLPPREFQHRTSQAYGSIAAVLGGRHPVRFWNYVPGIVSSAGEGIDRYMVFNAGRFEAYLKWFGGPSAFDRALPTASAVGHRGDDLVIHALAARLAGRPVENPRQIAPFHYSTRFGPQPPCFARATMLPAGLTGRSLILVGGTASIRGEDTMHCGDLASQLAETFDNLASLICAARGCQAPRPAGREALKCFRELRVYVVRADDSTEVAAATVRSFPSVRRVEYARADLCRPGLLVEIEGVAEGSERS